MKEILSVSKEYRGPVMAEMSREITDILGEPLTASQQKATAVFYGVLCQLMMEIFGYLPSEEKSRILVNCQTWLDLGLLMGKSPQKLVEILEKVNAEIQSVPVPDWVSENCRG